MHEILIIIGAQIPYKEKVKVMNHFLSLLRTYINTILKTRTCI